MVMILSKLDADGVREIFVGQFEDRQSVLDVVEKSKSTHIDTTIEGQTRISVTGPTFIMRKMGTTPVPSILQGYRVPSQNVPGSYYVVHVDAEGITVSCTCPDFQYRKMVCKHQGEILRFGVEGYTRDERPIPTVNSKTFNAPDKAVVPRKNAAPFHHHTVMVPSQSDWRKTYQVGLDAVGYPVSCTCPSFTHRQQICKHMKSLFNKRVSGGNIYQAGM